MDNIKAMPTIGTYYIFWFFGLLIKAIEDDTVLFCEEYEGEAGKVHRCKVYYGNRPYFRFNGSRVYFDDILRTA